MTSARVHTEQEDRLIAQSFSYDPEDGKLRWITANRVKKAGDLVSVLHNIGYLRVRLRNNFYLAHRVAWFLYYGEWPKSGQIDHINGDRADNRISNLRQADALINSRNRATPNNNTSGVIGVRRVTLEKGVHKWRAEITVKGKRKNLGRYDDIGDALMARKQAEAKYAFHQNHGR